MKTKLLFFVSLILSSVVSIFAQNSQGFIQPSTNLALPFSYNFQEYVYAEPDDQGECLGNENNSAKIEEVFMAQTHRHEIGHPLFFTIGYRPALLQLAVTGEGVAPDVQVEGILKGNSLGILCLKGPDVLQSTIDLDTPNFEDYFSVTLPKAWIQDGLELEVIAGTESRAISSEELKIGSYTEMNLVMVNMDVLDYNSAPPIAPIFDNFLEELASAIPASIVRFGIFPETLKFQEIIANNDTEELVRLRSRSEMGDNGIFSDGYVNSIAVQFLGNMHRSTSDYLSTVYFGNTLNLAPGGWGGGKNFVGFDYTDIFIHELGHALSLPHWGEGSYNNESDSEYEFLYPYGGEGDNGGGRGEAWNFIQDQYEFVSPICEDEESEHLGGERSDCMQRNNRCVGQRSTGAAPWDGYGDFSAIAIHRYLVGASALSGQVDYRGETKDFRLNTQRGFPIASLDINGRTYTRDALQAQDPIYEERFDLPGEEQLNAPVYLVYGSIHETQNQANIVYKPIKFTGTLPPILDLTNPEIFEALKNPKYEDILYGTRDITLKLTYEDGSVVHAVNPYHSFARAPYDWGFHIWRDDVCNFSLVVPGDKKLAKVELYKRPFCVRGVFNDTEGNINYPSNNITAENFMDEAVYLTEYEFGAPPVLGPNTIGNRVWHDENQDGVQDEYEKGIAGVSLVLWEDSDDDGAPDWQGFLGVAVTDEEGYYSFGGLEPGNYLVFVWSLDNWEEGQPLEGMIPTTPFASDPNTDLDVDSHGRPGNTEDWGLTEQDIVSGVITLTVDGEPLNDGDREDDWFNFDPSGNMTIDFGFYVDGATNVENFYSQHANIYPNPSTNFIRFETAAFVNHSLSLINTNGQTVLYIELNSNTTQLDIGDLTVGLYAAVLRDEARNIQWSSKFIKLK